MNNNIQRGGAVGFDYCSGNVTIYECMFESNYIKNVTSSHTTADGGGVAFFAEVNTPPSNVLIEGTTFKNNEAYDEGGGLFVQNPNPSSVTTIQNNTFFGNVSKGLQPNDKYFDFGGGISLYNTKTTLINNTITRNRSETGNSIDGTTQRGAGISTGGTSAVALKNNIIVGNETYNKNGEVDTSSNFHNVAIPNITENINNIGIDNGTAIDPNDVVNTFGTITPELKNNGSGKTAGDIRWQGGTNNGYKVINTVPILPSDGSTVEGLAQNAAGVPLLPQGQRGFTRDLLNSDIGAIEAIWVKFDGNGAHWDKLGMSNYYGTEYYAGQDPNAILKVSYVDGTIVAEDAPTELSNPTLRF